MKFSVLSTWVAAVYLLASRGGAAGPAPLSAAALRSQAIAAAHPAPLVWRLCAGTDGSALVRTAAPSRSSLPPGANPRPRVALLTRSLPGCQVAGERLATRGGGASWLVHLSVPAGARPGRYTGQLVVPDGATASRRPVVLDVLPFELMRPSKQYAVSQVPVTTRQCCAPEAAETTAFRRLREIGIGSLCLAGAPPDRTALMTRMQTAGLRGPVLVRVAPETEAGPAPETAVRAGSPSLQPVPGAAPSPVRWYALCSSPPSAGRAADLRAGGARIACLMEGSETASDVDLPIFSAGGEGAARLLQHGGTPAAGTSGWWHWDAGTATALENRLRCGALLWKSGLSGALLEINAAATADSDWALRWEGVCQGVQDSRYLTTLFSLIRQVKDKDRSSPLPGKAEVAIAAALNGVAERPSPEAADRVRETAITWILQLGKLVWS